MKNFPHIACTLLCCTAALAGIAPSAARAERWPSLDDLASEKMLLIVHCRAEEVDGRLLYKVLDVWKGKYNPTAFAMQPPTGYINAMGAGKDRKPGEEVILFYTRHNQPKAGIEKPDMAVPVFKGGGLIYPPGYEELPQVPSKVSGVGSFKREITSRLNKPPKKDDGVPVATAEPTIPKDLAGNWRMLMTAGFDHEASIKAVGENRYHLVSGASRINGVYELRDDRLVAVEPKSTAAEGYVWKMHSVYMLTLIEQSDELANDYRGAVLFRAKTAVTQQITSKQEARISNEDLNRLLPERKAPDPAKIEHHRGFRTIQRTGSLGEFWDSVKDQHKMQGLISERLTRDQIDAFWMLEVNIAIAANLGDSKYPTLQDELLAFMAKGNRFLASPPLRRDPPPKYLVALFRTTKGEYGLITRYPEFCLIELGGYIGAAPIPADAKASK